MQIKSPKHTHTHRHQTHNHAITHGWTHTHEHDHHGGDLPYEGHAHQGMGHNVRRQHVAFIHLRTIGQKPKIAPIN